MSRGTTFILLKKSRRADRANPCLAKAKQDEYEKNHKNDLGGLACNGKDIPKYPKYMESGVYEYDLIDKDGIGWNRALEFNFCSVFNDVRTILEGEFKMNSYSPWLSQMDIDQEMAREMLVAAEYLLLEHYDEKIEDIMDNRFIDPLGSLSGPYSDFKYRKRFPDDKDNWSSEDYSDCLKSLRAILHSFLNAEDREDYRLIVELWG